MRASFRQPLFGPNVKVKQPLATFGKEFNGFNWGPPPDKPNSPRPNWLKYLPYILLTIPILIVPAVVVFN